MPSSPNYVRDYRQEYAIETPQRRKARVDRMAARRQVEKTLGHKIPTGYDVDHKRPISKGGAGRDPKNLGLQKASSNRSYPRTSSGAMKSRKD